MITDWEADHIIRDIGILEEIALRLDGRELLNCRAEARCLATQVWMIAWKWAQYLRGWDGETTLEHPVDGWTLVAETKGIVAAYLRDRRTHGQGTE